MSNRSREQRVFLSQSKEFYLSKRLRALADFVPVGKKVADIGADHAHLLIHLAKRGDLIQGIAGELNEGPWQNAREQVERSGETERIEVRLGDGLSVLAAGEADVIVLAGMGGSLMARILEAGAARLPATGRLILQPNTDSDQVRRWLIDHEWQLIDERLVEDGDFLYEILVAEPGEGIKPYRFSSLPVERQIGVGPLLWQKKDPLLPRKLREELAGLIRISEALQQGKSADARQRKLVIEEEIAEIRRLLTWLEGQN